MLLTMEYLSTFVKQWGLKKTIYYLNNHKKEFKVTNMDNVAIGRKNGREYFKTSINDNNFKLWDDGEIEIIEYCFDDFINDLDKAEQKSINYGYVAHVKFYKPIDKMFCKMIFGE